MMSQHFRQEVNHLCRGDTLIVQPKNQLPAAGYRRQSRNTAAFTSDSLLWRPATRCPRLAQESRQRDVRLVLKIKNRPVAPHGAADLWQFLASPGRSFLLRQLEILPFRLLVTHPCFMQPRMIVCLETVTPKLAWIT